MHLGLEMGVNPFGGRHWLPGHLEGRGHLHHRFWYQMVVRNTRVQNFIPSSHLLLAAQTHTPSDRHTDTMEAVA
jgi:hypothetical protein